MMRFLCAFLILALLSGCATGPGGGSSFDAKTGLFVDHTSPGSGGQVAVPTNLLQFRLTLNDEGVFDGVHGLYAILINSLGQPIEATNSDKFTDFISWDGTNVIWYNRRTDAQNTSFFFTGTAILNQVTTFTPDRRTMTVTFNLQDTTAPLNQFVPTTTFTAHAVTTDRFPNAILGRVLDSLGPGPSLAQNPLFTVPVDKNAGAVSPLPSEYPNDALQDWIVQPDLDATFPYVNYDIKKFEVIFQ